MTMQCPQCEAIVYVRDTYRRTGRGPTGFSLHYTRRRCSRYALKGGRFCKQHQHQEGRQEELLADIAAGTRGIEPKSEEKP